MTEKLLDDHDKECIHDFESFSGLGGERIYECQKCGLRAIDE